MSLKSSEINNYSWNINAVLISPFCSSSCCQACFPTIVRPIKNLWKLTLKMFFNSPELNRSVIFSLYFLRMSKKMDYFLRNLVSISIHFLSFFGMMLGESTGSLLCGFAFVFDRLAKSFTFSCDACSSDRFSELFVLLFQSITHLFDPWEILTQDWVLSSLRDQILISTPCLPYRQLVVTSSTGPIFVFPWIHPFGCDDPSQNCSSVSLSWNTVQSQQHVQILHLCKFYSLCQSVKDFLIRSSYRCNRRFWCDGMSFTKGTSALISLRTIDCPIRTWSWRDSNSSHMFATAP